MMAVSVDTAGNPVGVAVACQYSIDRARLDEYAGSTSSTVTPTAAPTPTRSDVGIWDPPGTKKELMSWPMSATSEINGVSVVTAAPTLRTSAWYILRGSFSEGMAAPVRFRLSDLKSLQPGVAIVSDNSGEQRVVDLNQLVEIACTDNGLTGTRSPSPSNGSPAPTG